MLKYQIDNLIANPKKYAFDFQTFIQIDNFNNNPNGYTYNINVSGNNITRVSYFGIKKFEIDNYIENINNFNSIINVNGVNYACTTGYYDLTALIAHINGVIAASGVTLVLNAVTKKITISAAGIFSFTTQNVNDGDTLLNMLGFTGKILQGLNSYVAKYPAKSQYTDYIDVCSNTLSLYTKLFASNKSSVPTQLFRITVRDKVAGSGELITYSDTNIKYSYDANATFGNLDIFLIDQFGNYLEPLMGKFSIILESFEASGREILFNV